MIDGLLNDMVYNKSRPSVGTLRNKLRRNYIFALHGKQTDRVSRPPTLMNYFNPMLILSQTMRVGALVTENGQQGKPPTAVNFATTAATPTKTREKYF